MRAQVPGLLPMWETTTTSPVSGLSPLGAFCLCVFLPASLSNKLQNKNTFNILKMRLANKISYFKMILLSTYKSKIILFKIYNK